MSDQQPVFIGGASSFVGSHLVTYLASKGIAVVAGHSRPLDSYTGLQAARFAMMREAGAQFRKFDLTEHPAIVRMIEELQPAYWITHSGWAKAHADPDYDLWQGHAVHVAPFSRIFSALKSVGCKGVVSTGSAAEYGLLTPECREDDLTWPMQPYGMSKLSKTIRLKQLAFAHELPVRVVRLFNPFGILDKPERILAAAARALLRGEPLEVADADVARDFTSVRDVCRGYLSVMHDLESGSPFEIYNLCNGAPVEFGTILTDLARELGASPGLLRFGQRALRPGEARVIFGNNTKAKERLQWRPTPLSEALPEFAHQVISRSDNWSTPPTAAPLVRVSRSSVNSDTVSRVSVVLRRGFLGMGTEVDAFERELRVFIGGDREVICVNSGTAALHLAVQGCGIGPGDEVLVPTLTFVASFQAISAAGATPVACDVRESDCWIDLADAERRITARTRAIMPVHYGSGSGDLDGLYRFAEKHRLRVIEDAAHAFGCTFRGARIGSFGDVVCFSFDGIKNITAGEGGAVVTSDPQLAERVKTARLLGVENDTEKRYAGQRSWDFDVLAQGWRYHMSNINAALGRSQLTRFENLFAPHRVRLAHRYVERLASITALRHLGLKYGEVVPHIFPVFVPAERRDELREKLKAANIESGIHYKPNHLLSLFGGGKMQLPVAERIFPQLITLPLHAELTDEEQDRVIDVVRAVLS